MAKTWKNLFGKNDKIDASVIAVSPGLLLPKAVIVDSGSNGNGRYIKFGDGTMICMNHPFTLNYLQSNTLQSTWTYPVPFVNDNVVVLPTAELMPLGKDMNTTIAPRKTYAASAQIALYSHSNSWVAGDTREAKLLAIGRWK